MYGSANTFPIVLNAIACNYNNFSSSNAVLLIIRNLSEFQPDLFECFRCLDYCFPVKANSFNQLMVDRLIAEYLLTG